ncbi:hypothetical protein HMPREF0841_1912 [Streptococcus pyogenes ATCC 10782]|nr:hypothetical protein HMPREF0841_1912 [Streptococcus pyogenes ATCC 10782]
MKFTIITNYDTLSRKSFTIEGDNMTIFRKKKKYSNKTEIAKALQSY